MGADDDGRPLQLDGRRRTRWLGLVGLALSRLWKRATQTVSGRIVATIAAVAVTIAFLLIVTGVALALADGSVTTETDAEVQVAAEEDNALSGVDGVEGPRLGQATERAATIRSEPGVDHASPVLFETMQLESTDGEAHPVLVVGVVPDGEPRTVAGVSTAPLEPDDTADEQPRPDAEVVLSSVAADRLDVTAGDEIGVVTSQDEPGEPTLTTTAVEETQVDGERPVPVALVRLDELQAVSGADDGDLATQLLVWGEPDAAQSAAGDAYPDATIEPTASGSPSALFGDGLAFATSLLALVVGVTICAAFVATTMGLAVEGDRRTLAVLEAVGVPTRSRLAIVAVTTAATTLSGAILGIGLGVLGITAVNAIASATLATGSVATLTPLFVPYAIVVALLAGLVAVPYPLAVAKRTTALDEVSR